MLLQALFTYSNNKYGPIAPSLISKIRKAANTQRWPVLVRLGQSKGGTGGFGQASGLY